MSTTKKYPVYNLTINLRGMTVETGFRVFDLRSFQSMLISIRSSAWGRIGLTRFALRLHQAPRDGEEWCDTYVPLAIRPAGEGVQPLYVPVSFIVLSSLYADQSPERVIAALRKKRVVTCEDDLVGYLAVPKSSIQG
jgi:hypothetical protein